MMRLDFSRRADLAERMDEPDCSETMLFRTLDQFRLVNRAFSRYTTLLNRYVVQEMRKAPDREYFLIDLGAGGCDIARWLTRQARRYALRLRVLALDGDPRVVRYARKANRDYPEIKIRMMDALDVPVQEPVDFVFSNHLLHHLTDVQVVELVKRLDGAGVHGYILSDIARSRFAWHSFRLAVTPFAHRSFVVSDGLTSILRSFTVAELRQLLRGAPLQNPVEVLSMFPSRLALVGRGMYAAGTVPLDTERETTPWNSSA